MRHFAAFEGYTRCASPSGPDCPASAMAPRANIALAPCPTAPLGLAPRPQHQRQPGTVPHGANRAGPVPSQLVVGYWHTFRGPRRITARAASPRPGSIALSAPIEAGESANEPGYGYGDRYGGTSARSRKSCQSQTICPNGFLFHIVAPRILPDQAAWSATKFT